MNCNTFFSFFLFFCVKNRVDSKKESLYRKNYEKCSKNDKNKRYADSGKR